MEVATIELFRFNLICQEGCLIGVGCHMKFHLKQCILYCKDMFPVKIMKCVTSSVSIALTKESQGSLVNISPWLLTLHE